MPNKISLRKATQLDSTAIADVYLVSRKELLAYAPLAHTDASIRAWIHDTLIPTFRVTVAEDNGLIVGMMALSSDQNSGWIDQLYLLPTVVGRGIGSLFVELAKTTLGSPVRLYTFQENIRAKRFYERHGFQVIALSDGSTNEEHCPDILYEWRQFKFE